MIDPKKVYEIVQSNESYLATNHELIDIFEGQLADYIAADLRSQLSVQSSNLAIKRMAPINILPKFIDKLTNIYQTSVSREVIEGTDSDKELLAYYIEKMIVNQKMNCANEMFNLSKATLIQPYVHDGLPQLRVIQSDKFVVFSDNPFCPEKPTHVILIYKRGDKKIFHTYSATEFMISNDEGKIETELMAQYGNAGVNDIGRLPFVYVNYSQYKVQPKVDNDTLKMVKLLPLMLSDLNLASMFQSFSIIYGINVNDENLQMSPNAFWRLTSNPSSDQKPEIGQLKPQVDIDQVLGLIQAELSMWLGSKGIRSSSIGGLDVENIASGISKVIDEMDTFEAREKQVEYFQNAEKDLWNLVLKDMHPYWLSLGELKEPRNEFTKTATVATKFSVQLPMQTRGQVVKDVKEEYAAGFISRRGALTKLNPEMSQEEIDELMEEIDAERGVEGLPGEEEKETEEKPEVVNDQDAA